MLVEILGQVFPCWKNESCPVEHIYIKKTKIKYDALLFSFFKANGKLAQQYFQKKMEELFIHLGLLETALRSLMHWLKR